MAFGTLRRSEENKSEVLAGSYTGLVLLENKGTEVCTSLDIHTENKRF